MTVSLLKDVLMTFYLTGSVWAAEKRKYSHKVHATTQEKDNLATEIDLNLSQPTVLAAKKADLIDLVR